MATVSELIVLLKANTAGFQKGMASAAKTTSTFSTVAKVGFAIAAVAAVKFAADSIEAYNDHQDALLKLQNTIKNSPQLIGASVKAFEDQATALQELTGVQDEEILRADAVLGRFQLTGNQIRELNPLVLDFARATGTDATSSASLLGKALLGNARALKTIGVSFTATGNRAKDFATIQAALEEKVGGLAAAYGKTLPGQLDIAAAKFDDIKEVVGAALVPILAKLLDILKPLLGVLKLAADNLDLVVAAGLGFAAWKFIPPLLAEMAVGFQALGFHGLALGAVELSTGFASAVPPAVAFAAAFGGLTAATAAWDPLGLAGDADKLRDSMEVNTKTFGASDVILGRVAVSSNLVGNSFRDTTEATKKTAAEQADLATQVDRVKVAMEAQRDAARALVGGLLGLIASSKDVAQQQAHINRLQDEGKDHGKKYNDLVLQLLGTQDDLNQRLRDYAKELKTSGLSVDDAVGKVVKLGKSVGLTKGDVLDALKPLKDFKSSIDNLPAGTPVGTEMIHGIIQGVESGRGTLAGTVSSIVRQAIQAGRDAAKAGSPSKLMMKLGNDLMEGLKNGITDKDREVAQALTDSIGKMLDAAKGALSDFRSKMQGFAGGISGGFGSFSDLIGAFGEGGTPVGDVISGQLAGARGFADVLDALQRQGASKGLLSQIAGAGTEGMGFAQALLQGGPALVGQASRQLEAINKIADHTGKGLSNDFFGVRMDKLQGRADRIAELLAEANRLQSGKGGDITLQIDGQTLARITRDELVKLGKRNVTTGL